MKKIIFILILFLVLVGFFIFQGIYLPKEAFSKEERIFLIEKGQGLGEISRNLEKAGLIKNGFYFKIYALFKGEVQNLQAGEYLLSPSMTISEITERLASGNVAKISLTIPEGFTLKQIEERLNHQFYNVTKQGLVTLRVGDFKNKFEFLENAPNEANLEGFLFPDTYQFFYSESSDEIARKMLQNFEQKLNNGPKEEIEKRGKSIFEIVTMASLLEKEVKTFEDKKLVSGILWKRLKSGIPLQVDAAITYITGRKTTKITKEETEIDSPYNTYKYSGLPIGPICNPGLESIIASVYPKDSNFWYYLSTLEGETIFSKTLEEHNIAKAKYLK